MIEVKFARNDGCMRGIYAGKLRLVEERYMEMAERAGQPDFYADPKAASKLLREQKRLEPIVTAYRSFCKAKKGGGRAARDAGRRRPRRGDEGALQEEYTALKKQLGGIGAGAQDSASAARPERR